MRSKFKVGDIATPKIDRSIRIVGDKRVVFPESYGGKLRFKVTSVDFDGDLHLELVGYNKSSTRENLKVESISGDFLQRISYHGFKNLYINPNYLELYKEPKEVLLKKFF